MSSLCDYSDVYVLVKVTVTVAQETTAAPNNANKQVLFKNFAPFTNCISRINNKTTHKQMMFMILIVMPMNNLIECSHNYSKTSATFWLFCRDEPNLANNEKLF